MRDDSIRAVEAEQRAETRRLARLAMAILDYDQVWTGSMGQVAVQAAVVHGIESLLHSGHTDPFLIIERVLRNVGGSGRLTKIKDQMIDSDRCIVSGQQIDVEPSVMVTHG